MRVDPPVPPFGTTIPGVEHRSVEAGGLRWHLVTAGHGPTVVLAAGYPQSWWAWRHVIPLLAPHHTVIAIDLPGQGDSDASPVGYDSWTVAGLVTELLDALGLERVTYVGHDVGAWVGFALGHRSPERLDALALVDGNIAGVNLDLDDDGGYGGWHFVFQRVPELPEAMLVGHERRVIEWFSTRMTRHRNDVVHTEADLDEYERAYSRPSSLRGMLEYYRAVPVNAESATTHAGPLGMPVLAIVGDRSGSTELPEALASRAADLTSVVLADTGHYVPEERPTEVAAAITALVARASAPGAA
ncbi:alpha/beta fold hydrolase [Curtobacterium sp. 1P10AnD]|uniref:alpha/beta fold hydrolase n=1 Tax=Curtobacterium sp. 1P10AnD TaxID=3132283 RepID=UPI0039A01DAB